MTCCKSNRFFRDRQSEAAAWFGSTVMPQIGSLAAAGESAGVVEQATRSVIVGHLKFSSCSILRPVPHHGVKRMDSLSG